MHFFLQIARKSVPFSLTIKQTFICRGKQKKSIQDIDNTHSIGVAIYLCSACISKNEGMGRLKEHEAAV